eukprot:scaffold307_cov390-Prasinococcus_capsulatus_cf.AAC.25
MPTQGSLPAGSRHAHRDACAGIENVRSDEAPRQGLQLHYKEGCRSSRRAESGENGYEGLAPTSCRNTSAGRAAAVCRLCGPDPSYA